MGTTGGASDGEATVVGNVTATMIAQVSPFTVGADGDFSTTDFEYYATQTEEELKQDNPGLPTIKYNEAWANLICDAYEASKGAKNLKSEKIGDYSYTKDGGAKSSYRLKYEEILKQWNTEQPTVGQGREDVDHMPNQFKLDQQPVQKFEEQD